MAEEEKIDLLAEALEIAAIAKVGSAFAFEKTGNPKDGNGDMATFVQLFDVIQKKAEKMLDSGELEKEEPQPTGS